MFKNKFVVLILVLSILLGTMSTAFAQNSLTVWADGTRAPALLEIADQVSAELGIELNVVELGFGEIRDQLLVAGPVGEGPDVLIGAHDWLGQLVTNGAIAPINLSEEKAAEFHQAALNLFTYDGQLYGVPYALENLALVRNPDLVPEHPATWQEVAEIAATMPEGQYAFLLQTNDAYHAFPVQTAFGGYIFGTNEDGSYNPSDIGLANEGSLAAAQWMSEMYANGYMLPSVHYDQIYPIWEEGNLGMFLAGPWSIERLEGAGIPYVIEAIPGAEGGNDAGIPFLGGQGFMISAFSENQLLAEIFLTEYVATQEVMQDIFEAGKRFSAYVSVDGSTVADAGAFSAAGSLAVAMPTIPEMGAVWTAAGNAQVLVSQGEDPIVSYTNAVQQIVEAIAMTQATERIVGVPGSYQSAAGCDGDWNPACAATLMESMGDGMYTLTVTLPAGDYEYKVAMNGGWDENYGVGGEAGGANVVLSIAEETTVTFKYDDTTNIITDSVNNPE